MVSVQLYESYSRAANAIYELGMPASDYLESYVEDLALRHEKFLVEFSQDPEVGMEDTSVRLPLSKLVIGLANSWAEDGDKTLYVDPSDIGRAYSRLNARGRTIRGFMFWTIDEEGSDGIYMADELNRSLNGTQPFAVVSWPGQKRK
jgi:chitinase